VNANDATITGLTAAQTGSTVADTALNAAANPGFDLVAEVAAGSAPGSSGAPYTLTLSVIDLTSLTQPWPTRTLRQAFDPAHSWALSGTGPHYQCTQTLPIALPGNAPGGPLAGHTLQYVASLVSPGAQIASPALQRPLRPRLTRTNLRDTP
jgi:hypothetical protein